MIGREDGGVFRGCDGAESGHIVRRSSTWAAERLGPVDHKRKYRDNGNMDREHVIATLRGYESELRAAGIVRLSLFGSTARGDDRPDSDIDLLAAFDDTRRISLLDVVGMEEQISRLLGRTVELVEEGRLKPRVQKNVEAEAVRAF
jgi:predicted nucleotidyltransferase